MKRFAAAALAGVVLCLAACVPETPEPEPTRTATSPVESPTATAAPPEATPEPTVYPGVDLACDAVLSPQAMYDYNSNFNLIGEFEPSPGSLSAAVVERNGKACRWVNASSDLTIDLALARIPEPANTELRNETSESSNSVPTYGVEGYFAVDGGTGGAQAFTADYWIVLESSYFAEPGDAEPLMQAVVGAL